MVIVAIIALIAIIAIVLIVRKNSSPSIDPEARHLGLYFLEYQFIPTFIGPFERGGHTDAMFLNIGNWEKLFKTTFKDQHKIEWKKLHVTKSMMNGKEYIVYTFPEPKEVPEAKYGVVVLNPSEHRASYYTMEYSFGGDWVMGSNGGGSHFNLGSLGANATLQSFMDRIVRIEER